MKPGEKIKPAFKRFNLSPGLGDSRLREDQPYTDDGLVKIRASMVQYDLGSGRKNSWYLLVWQGDASRIIEHELFLFYDDKNFATP